jgi:hypothetical protein
LEAASRRADEALKLDLEVKRAAGDRGAQGCQGNDAAAEDGKLHHLQNERYFEHLLLVVLWHVAAAEIRSDASGDDRGRSGVLADAMLC